MQLHGKFQIKKWNNGMKLFCGAMLCQAHTALAYIGNVIAHKIESKKITFLRHT